MKEFNNIKQMNKYYDKEKNLFYIKDDIKINFDLVCNWNIDAWNINAKNIDAWSINAKNIDAWDINARDWNIDAWNINAHNIDSGNINAWNIKANNIKARNIDAWNIDAGDISYYAVCFAYDDIICDSIQGRRENSRHFVLGGKLVVGGEKV